MPRKTKPPSPVLQAAASLGGNSGTTLTGIHLIRASKNRYGRPRSAGKLQSAQHAIVALFPFALPPPRNVNLLKLTDEVNDQLARDPDYKARYGKLSRQTVMRALETLLAANR